MLARLIGLVVFLPFVFFVFKKWTSKKECFYFLFLFFLVCLQGFAGWYMVKSGLLSVPEVSHFRLLIHFWLAFLFLAACFWGSLQNGFLKNHIDTNLIHKKIEAYFLSFMGAIIVLQFSYGALNAGLKAGKISSTFPKINEQLIPEGMAVLNGFFQNVFLNPIAVHFIHRWVGIFLFVFISVYYLRKLAIQKTQKIKMLPHHLFFTTLLLQVATGVLTILTKVNIFSALLHQFLGSILWLNFIYFVYSYKKSS